jgi:GNAT superfamily N-acetyltransferase
VRWGAATVSRYDAQRDERAAYDLWLRTLSEHWPVSQAAFRHVILGRGACQPGDHLVALAGRQVVDFAGTQSKFVPGERAPRGELMLVIVDPAYQGPGVGRQLLHRALATLERRGVTRAQLDGGGHTCFWPGVPTNLPQVWAFFQGCGWVEAERSFDLILGLDEHVTPAGICGRVRLPGVMLITVTPVDIPFVLAFEARHFPQWHHYYRQIVDRGGCADVVLARYPIHGIVGVSSAWYPDAPWPNAGQGWHEMLGENTGGMGPLGVADASARTGLGWHSPRG